MTSAVRSAAAADFDARMESWRARMERALDARLPGADAVPSRLHEAMRYAALGGGKRVRPALVFATAATLGIDEDTVEAAACAIELVHVYSLVHDDLPAMDDDDLRRGRPTCHKAYDEATALLVGDAMQPLAFHWLATDPKLPPSPAVRLRLIDLMAQAIGTAGMAGGQAIDLQSEGRTLSIAEVDDMHARKTGAVIRASVMLAAECAPQLPPEHRASLERFAAAVGLAFQIQDDLLDVIGDVATLGKATGADRERGKPTYPALIGVEASQARMRRLHEEALSALALFGDGAAPLVNLSNWLLSREY
ncbi:MAG: polyprenyl synthetase family protein [Gammaproteobacteria bacterium]|nr:polyprenyl synthetase family protein [Gammaproteobacteria bacterium]